MEVEEIQTQVCKFPRIPTHIRQKGDEQYPDGEDDRGVKSLRGKDNPGVGINRLCGWPSSRIVRVSRASGGKDRHSKVWTSKGPRDRRVRLSVSTAIQLFDLQDRLGYDQPSKAIEWLLNAAVASIDELPPINVSFHDIPKHLSDDKRSSAATEHGFDSADLDLDGDLSYPQHKHVSLSRSTCSSTSDTSKGSGLSLSRSENRIKSRERTKERTAENEREKENESQVCHHHNVNAIAQNSSFTELLTGGIRSVSSTATNINGSAHQSPGPGGGSEASNLLHKSSRQWNSTPMDYFTSGLIGPSSSRASPSMFVGNPLPQPMTVPQFSVAGDHQPELQYYSFVTPEHLIPVVTAAGSGGGSNNNNNNNNADYGLNFTVSSSSSSLAAGCNRGTLQSNSPSLLPHLQRFSPIDGSSNFFIWTTASDAADQKGKGKY